MDLLSVIHTGMRANGRQVLRDIDLTLQPGQRLAIAGETGSGKTSLLRIIGGLLQADEGNVLYQGLPVPGPFEKLIPGHPRIAYLSQHFELRNNYRVEEELESRSRMEPPEAATIYRLCQIDHLLQRKTTELSGGERQRIVLAALLTTQPSILLLDEPFSNLDAFHKATIRAVLQDINQSLHTAMIMVSHDPEDILPWAQHLLILREGRISQQGTPAALYRKPVSEYCAGLLGAYNLVQGSLAADLLGNTATLPAGRQLLVRPEELVLSVAATAVSGRVEEVYYYGAYEMVSVRTAEQSLQVRTAGKNIRPGDTVWLALVYRDDYCFI